jgi:ribonuclease P protein component
MLTQKHRFHGHGSLRYVYKHGESIRSRVISIKFTKNKFRDHSRFSVVVSKKVLKSAVGRNRIRRRVYEIIRLQLPHLTESYDVVALVFSSEVATLPHSELENLIKSQLEEAGIITHDLAESDIITDSKHGDILT